MTWMTPHTWRAVLAAAAIAPACAARMHAQDPEFTSIGAYAISIPLGDTHRYVGVPSWMGVTWDGLWPLRNRTWAGIELGLNDFFDQDNRTTNFPSGSATGFQVRDLLVMSVMGTGRWFALKSSHGPYLGLGVGGSYVSQFYQLGPISPFNRTGVHLTAAPEVGYVAPFLTDIDAVVSIRLATPVSAGDYLGGGRRSFRFMMLSFGLAER